MSRIILMAILAAATVAGCNRFPDLTVQVTANLAPDGAQCAITEEQEGVVPRGVWDLSYNANQVSVGRTADYGYVMNPRLESYLIDNSLEFQAVSQNFQVTTFDVTIKLPDNTIPALSGGLPNPYRVPAASPFIEANIDENGVSRGFAFIEAIPLSYLGAIQDILNNSPFSTIVLDVRANGTTSGGFSQQSPPYSWPIDLCNTCLAARCEDDGTNAIGDGIGCYPGQDGNQYCSQLVAPPE